MRLALTGACLLLAGCGGGDADRAGRLRSAGPNPDLTALLRVADVGAGRRAFGQCAACHTIGVGGQSLAGPNLHDIMGRGVASNPRFGYTQALIDHGGRWDAARMDAWLAAPARAVPGTRMAFVGVRDPMERADLIAYLQSESR
ncbi:MULTISPECIES: c-type cytochrome [unclassified Sphingomonas]|uniref:c-type cytochrome n=1 Tax=unclassified Sphingomonas TaxID=196159 RepID=UPI0007005F39|nr:MULTISPECIES: c-type cytochrome [unclassified Sphingomonas]KQM65421.1 cytochrome C [Sphingomonas sp. Leaf16]KQN17023.1 cytochrome C [Sphingomonas sp. Leaf32]KQN17197.1 cytochrome C [Sphingomonas sp. Leaf29]